MANEQRVPDDVKVLAEKALENGIVKAHILGEPVDLVDTIARAIMADRKAPTEGEGVKVVLPLTWEEPSPKNNNVWVARTVLGDYCVGCEGGWWYAVMDEGFRTWEWEPENDARSYFGPHAAQRACQADYEQRILSALVLPLPQETGERDGVEARCERCNGPARVWFAPNALWNLVKGGPDATDDPGGMLCPNCFIDAAEAAGTASPVGSTPSGAGNELGTLFSDIQDRDQAGERGQSAVDVGENP